MNGLRLTLLVIGIIILAVIYWRGTASQKGNRLKRFSRRRREQPPLDGLPMSPEREEGVDYTRTLADLNELMVEKRDGDTSQSAIGRALRRGRERLTQPAAAPPDPKPDEAPEPEKILTLFLTAPAGGSYRGIAVRDAAEAVGLHFGDMGVFHHFGLAGHRSQQSLFCLANMFEPGNFDLENIHTHETAGLVMFMRLPVPIDGSVAFELMLNTAQRLQERLGGELRDGEHRPLARAAIDRMRKLAADARG
ncbi:MAG: cell division protein ZipA C-terminal FtsZ-binding domain-containing protein [Gammaproteobacteria bacterium]